MIFFKQLTVNTRFGVKPLSPGIRNDFNKVAVAYIIFGKENQVISFVINTVHLVKPCSCGNIDLTTYYGFDSLCHSFFIEVDCAEHYAVVGDGKACLTEAFCGSNKRPDTARAVKQAELTVKMQMCKTGH